MRPHRVTTAARPCAGYSSRDPRRFREGHLNPMAGPNELDICGSRSAPVQEWVDRGLESRKGRDTGEAMHRAHAVVADLLADEESRGAAETQAPGLIGIRAHVLAGDALHAASELGQVDAYGFRVAFEIARLDRGRCRKEAVVQLPELALARTAHGRDRGIGC